MKTLHNCNNPVWYWKPHRFIHMNLSHQKANLRSSRGNKKINTIQTVSMRKRKLQMASRVSVAARIDADTKSFQNCRNGKVSLTAQTPVALIERV